MWHITAGVLLGIAGGLCFFLGLSWTVERLAQAKRPSLLMLASFFVRFAVVGICFFIAVKYGGIAAVLSCLAGFALVQAAAVIMKKRESPGSRRV
ncbi:MAG: hypothetical protein HZC28_10650 [Spirochaetes bacterium]|nr:hypothetical protein [Spirochaetota bacterium]